MKGPFLEVVWEVCLRTFILRSTRLGDGGSLGAGSTVILLVPKPSK